MGKFDFIETLMVKQTCRFFEYKFEMGSNQLPEDSTNIYSLKFLKALYDYPKDNINKITKEALTSIENDKVKREDTENGKTNHIEKRMLLEFFKKVVDMKSQPSKDWNDLQHYLCFVYRDCMTNDPDPEQEVLSPHFIEEMREMVRSLLEEDKIQLCLRLFSLVREYTVFAHKLHQKITNVEISIENLFYYYEAFLSASKNISKIFPELENLLINTYKLGWLDVNTSIFMYYFYETPNVQNVIREFGEMKDSVSIKTAGIYTVLTELHKLWRSQMLGINGVIANKLGAKFKGLDNNMMSAHKRILSKNFWIDRTSDEKSLQELHLFDCQLFTLVGNKSIQLPDPTLDDWGQCICEDCLILTYESMLEISENKIVKDRLKVVCQFCREQVDLDHLRQHANAGSNCTKLSRVISDKIEKVKLEMSNSKRIPSNQQDPLLSALNSVKINNVPGDISKDPSAYEPRAFKNNLSHDDAKLGLAKIKTTSKINRKSLHHNLLKHRNATSLPDKDKENKCKQQPSKTAEIAPAASENTTKSVSPKREQPKAVEVPKNSKGTNTASKNGGMTFPCGHSCKLEEELKTEFKKAYQDTCDHHKESKKCDCTFCEVFGSTSSLVHKTNETRNRLRIRLNQRNDVSNKTKPNPPKVNQVNAKVKDSAVAAASKPAPTAPELKPAVPLNEKKEKKTDLNNDIHGLLSFIEGNASVDKLAVAKKKAAKKARQRNKKEQERLQIEEEERRRVEEERRRVEEERQRVEEERRRDEERLRNEELARQLSEKAAKLSKKEIKKRRQKSKQLEAKAELMEETIPAMVTIKRVLENHNSLPTVTITLKGSTPDQDKLLYTLVNGHDGKDDNAQLTETKKNKKNKNSNSSQHKQDSKTASLEANSATNKKKNSKSSSSNNNNNNKVQQNNTLITKELRVTLAVDPASKSDTSKKQISSKPDSNKQSAKNSERESKKNKSKEVDVNIPMLKLPPGITITKVERPMSGKNYKLSSIEPSPYDAIPVTKSGVIVVDTERLIKQSSGSPAGDTAAVTIAAKKSKKKRNKKQAQPAEAPAAPDPGKASMVTLKNPIFRGMPCFPQDSENAADLNGGSSQQAAIFKNENGMVTIRSSRLQQSLSNGGGPMPSLLSELKPVLGPEVPATYMSACNFSESSSRISPFNAQEILSGLPGIEITKVDKNAARSDADKSKASQTAEVSIIPASNGGDKFNFDKDDLHYDNVFTPKDILEDDMDADERELEAFKRFCQQSVPPKRKEKVAHLNVKDIVLKKKNDKISA